MWKALVLAAALPKMMHAEPVRDLSVPLVAVAAYDQARLVGAWYEVAQTPTFRKQDCHGTTVVVAARHDSRLTVKIACHKGTLSGPVLPLEGVLVQTDSGLFRLRLFRLAALARSMAPLPISSRARTSPGRPPRRMRTPPAIRPSASPRRPSSSSWAVAAMPARSATRCCGWISAGSNSRRCRPRSRLPSRCRA